MYQLTDSIYIKMQERCRNIKDEIILEVFKSNNLQAYEKNIGDLVVTKE